MKKRVLFVDDEPNVLQGLERMLRPVRSQVEMEFAESGFAALDIMARTPCDVLVTDMRMPGMGGAELLTEVVERYPGTVRIVLSGYAEQESALRAVGQTHQYLTKPCDPAVLRWTVTRACALHDLVRNPALRRLLGMVDALPTIPAVYLRLVEELRSERASMDRVGQIILQDMGLTTRVLQLVNSAFFGFSRRIANPTEAAVLLGVETLKAMVVSLHLFREVRSKDPGVFSIERLRLHSMATAEICQAICAAEGAGPQFRTEVLLCALLHDVGKLVIGARLPEQYAAAYSAASQAGIPLYEAEREVYGTTHGEVGAYLLGLWGLPDSIVDAARWHHLPGERAAGSPDSGRALHPVDIVHVANVLEVEARGAPDALLAGPLDEERFVMAGCGGRLAVWREACRSHAEEYGLDVGADSIR